MRDRSILAPRFSKKILNMLKAPMQFLVLAACRR